MGSNRVIKTISIVTAILVFLLAVGSFVLSFDALRQYAIAHGVTEQHSLIWAGLIDLSLVIYSLAVVNAYLQTESTWKQWALVGLYTIGTVVFNILHAPNNLQSQIVAAIAPVSLFFSFELLMGQLRTIVQKHSLTLNVRQLEAAFNIKSAEFDKLIDTKQAELDKLNVKIGQAHIKLDELEQAQSMSNNGIKNSILQAQKVKAENDSNSKQERLDNLLDILRVNPNEPVSNLAEALQVSRQTVYNDLSDLEYKNLISKNGNGWKVVSK